MQMPENKAIQTREWHADRPRYNFSPGLPAVLSLIVPGLGQAYVGKPFAGFLWLLTTLVGYIPFVLPGLVLHLLAITTACFRPVSTDTSAAG